MILIYLSNSILFKKNKYCIYFIALNRVAFRHFTVYMYLCFVLFFSRIFSVVQPPLSAAQTSTQRMKMMRTAWILWTSSRKNQRHPQSSYHLTNAALPIP